MAIINWKDASKIEVEKSRELSLDKLTLTDGGMPRVTDDLINLLVDKGVISLSELPEVVKNKILDRNSIRLGMTSE